MSTKKKTKTKSKKKSDPTDQLIPLGVVGFGVYAFWSHYDPPDWVLVLIVVGLGLTLPKAMEGGKKSTSKLDGPLWILLAVVIYLGAANFIPWETL